MCWASLGKLLQICMSMSLNSWRFEVLTSLLVGTATIAAVVISQEIAVAAKTGSEIYQIAIPITVQINSSVSDGSGVIIAKQGNTYTVLTNNHVVCSPENPTKCSDELTYTVRTYKGKNYPVTTVQRIQKSENDPDLAVVTFNSPEEYPVAILGNSALAQPGVDIYVYGFPEDGHRVGVEREPELAKGSITSCPRSRPGGYTLRYSATTWNGMSGSPVIDGDGRVIGIHGQGDRQPSDVLDNQGQTTGEVTVKTGFNAAIPINTLMSLRSQIGQSIANLTVDNTPSATSPVSLNNPNDAKTYYVRGLSRFDLGDFPGSIADFNQALQNQPNYAEAYFYRGLTRFNQGNLQGSLADYTQAIRLSPRYADAYYNRGVVLSALGNKPGAIADYSQVIRLDSTSAAAYNNRGLARSDLGDQPGAIDDYNQALRLTPDRANTYFNRGLAHFRLKDYQQALTDYTQAIRLNPNYAKAYGNRGITHSQLGNKQSAIADLQQAAQLFNAQGQLVDYQRALDRIREIQNQ